MAKAKNLKELLDSEVPSFEAIMFRTYLDTGEIYGRYRGPYGFTSSRIMVRGGKVNILDNADKEYYFSLAHCKKEARA